MNKHGGQLCIDAFLFLKGIPLQIVIQETQSTFFHFRLTFRSNVLLISKLLIMLPFTLKSFILILIQKCCFFNIIRIKNQRKKAEIIRIMCLISINQNFKKLNQIKQNHTDSYQLIKDPSIKQNKTLETINLRQKSSEMENLEIKDKSVLVSGSVVDPTSNLQVTLFKQILLNEGITKTHYYASLVHYFALTFIFVSIETLQPMFFQKQFNIQPIDAGTKNAQVLLVDIITKIIFAPIFGILNDRIGRKYVLLYGNTTVAITFLLISTIDDKQPFPLYYVYRVIYAQGAIAIATSPLLADYVHNITKGRGSSFNVVMASFGAVSSAFLINNLLINKATIQTTYVIVGCGFLVLATSYTMLLKNGLYFKDFQRAKLEEQQCGGTIKIGLRASKNIWILMGYITNFLGRADSILLTLYLVLWSYQQIDNGGENQDQAAKEKDFEKANIQAETLSGVAYTVILVFSLAYGFLFEKVNKFLLLLFIFLMTAVGCLMMNFATEPYQAYTFITMTVLGIGMAGLYTAALYLINKYAEVNHRGYITGLANIFSVAGIFVCAVCGGYLIDEWNDVAPFTVFGLFSLLACFVLLFAYFKNVSDIRRQKKLIEQTQNNNVYQD